MVQRSRRLLPFAASVALLAVVLVAFQLLAVTGRHYLPEQRRAEVRDCREGFLFLRESAVRGRMLVLFDKTSHVRDAVTFDYVRALDSAPASAPVSPTDFVAGLALSGVAREVYVVMPEPEWQRMRQTYSVPSDFFVEPDRIVGYLFGIRVIYSDPEHLPSFAEKVVTYSFADVVPDFPPSVLRRFHDPSTSDVFVVQKAR